MKFLYRPALTGLKWRRDICDLVQLSIYIYISACVCFSNIKRWLAVKCVAQAAPNYTGHYPGLLNGVTGVPEATWKAAAALYREHKEGDARVTWTGMYKNDMAHKQEWVVLLDAEYVSITALKYF